MAEIQTVLRQLAYTTAAVHGLAVERNPFDAAEVAVVAEQVSVSHDLVELGYPDLPMISKEPSCLRLLLSRPRYLWHIVDRRYICGASLVNGSQRYQLDMSAYRGHDLADLAILKPYHRDSLSSTRIREQELSRSIANELSTSEVSVPVVQVILPAMWKEK